MKLEQIPGDYDNVDQRALELLKTNDYKLAEYMRDYIKELYANIHMRDFYIRNLKDVILHYGWQDMPINNIQQFRVRFSFVNESSVNGEPLKYSDNTTYFTITPRLEQGERTYTKTLANPLKYYLEKLALPNQDPYNTPVWIRFEGYVMLRQVSQITLAVDSQSENWAEGVTFPSSGRWVKMNNSGRVFRFTGGEIDLNIELYTASAQ